MQAETLQLIPPAGPGQWTIAQIEHALSRRLPPELLSTRKQGNKEIPYIPWFEVNRILIKYCPGWQWRIDSIITTDSKLFLHGTLSIPTADGLVSRSATGQEDLKCSSFGDPSSNAESMAFRRAAARFGLGLYLYDKD